MATKKELQYLIVPGHIYPQQIAYFIDEDGEPWFRAVDLSTQCRIDVSAALRRHVSQENHQLALANSHKSAVNWQRFLNVAGIEQLKGISVGINRVEHVLEQIYRRFGTLKAEDSPSKQMSFDELINDIIRDSGAHEPGALTEIHIHLNIDSNALAALLTSLSELAQGNAVIGGAA